MSITAIIITILTALVGLLGVTTVRERGKRQATQKELDSSNRNTQDSLKVQKIKEESEYVKPENYDDRDGIGGPRN